MYRSNKAFKDKYLTKFHKNPLMGWGCGSLVERLPCQLEGLGSVASTTINHCLPVHNPNTPQVI